MLSFVIEYLSSWRRFFCQVVISKLVNVLHHEVSQVLFVFLWLLFDLVLCDIHEWEDSLLVIRQPDMCRFLHQLRF